MKFGKEFRKEHPETIEEKDTEFDQLNYSEWLEGKLIKINNWCSAYPLGVFPEPDFKKAHKVLTENNLSLDLISASNMRHVVTGIKKIINTK